MALVLCVPCRRIIRSSEDISVTYGPFQDQTTRESAQCFCEGQPVIVAVSVPFTSKSLLMAWMCTGSPDYSIDATIGRSFIVVVSVLARAVMVVVQRRVHAIVRDPEAKQHASLWKTPKDTTLKKGGHPERQQRTMSDAYGKGIVGAQVEKVNFRRASGVQQTFLRFVRVP